MPDVFADASSPAVTVEPSLRSDIIPEGQRDQTVTSKAGSMHRIGLSVEAKAAALHVVNDQQCRPPLHGRDVERIARSVGREDHLPGPDGPGRDRRSPLP
jgi:hypothetical protein